MAKSFGGVKGEALKKFGRDVLLGRVYTPEDVAGVVGFLAEEASGYMTRQMVGVDGGIEFS